MSNVGTTEESLGRAMLGHAELGDRRRTARLVRTFDELRRHPGGTLPDKLSSPADLKALYRLCDCEAVTHRALIEAVRTYTLLRIAKHDGPVLILHDATELDYTSLGSLTDALGQIGKGKHRGFICHNVLAVAADTGEVLGLLDQTLHRRARVPKGETLAHLRNRESRESRLWVKGTEHLPRDARLIDVADRGADTFEFLEHETHSGRRFVVRNAKARKVYAGHSPQDASQPLKGHLASLPELGRMTMDVQPQKGRAARRGAEFALRGGAVRVAPPHARRGHHGRDPLPLYVVQVAEVSPPPPGQKPLEWVLITNEPIDSFEDAWRVVGWYERRWIIEEYHKALKTGCGIEAMQFTTVERMQPAIALISAVATTLLSLRDASRQPDASTRPAETLFDAEYVRVLSMWRHRLPKPDWSVHAFFLALARLGGHQNRKRDHRPGWLVLWRGWTKLQSMLDGYAAAEYSRCG